jgi:pseudouridine synthase
MGMQGRSCSCDGSNSNCARCYGTGVIQPAGTSRTRLRKRPKAKRQTAWSAPTTPLNSTRVGTGGPRPEAKPVPVKTVMLNKPAGVSADEAFRLLPGETGSQLRRIGDLEADCEGILLFTNDARIIKLISTFKRVVPKTYALKLSGPASGAVGRSMKTGTVVDQVRVSADWVAIVGPKREREILLRFSSPKKEALRHLVSTLPKGIQIVRRCRIGYGNLELKGLRVGSWRVLTVREVLQAFFLKEPKPIASKPDNSRKRDGVGRRPQRNARGGPANEHKEIVREMARKTSGRSKGFNSLGQYFGDVVRKSDPLDGSKGKHVVRELGRFGSYPLHDGHGEESDI